MTPQPGSGLMLGVPVWSHDGIIWTGETYKDKVKLTFAKGASLKDAGRLFNRVSSVKRYGVTSCPRQRCPCIGTRMHAAASQFALVAQETGADGNVGRAIAALSRVTENCVSCHAAYRAH